MTLSVRQRILWWSVAGTLVILAAVFLFVDRGFRTTIRNSLGETVQAGARLAGELQRSEVQEGVDRSAALATSPTVRAAVETGDSATIAQELALLLQDSGMDWLAVASPRGETLAVVGAVEPERLAQARGLVAEARFFATGDLWRVDSSLMEVHASGLFFGPSLLGVLLSGSRVGPDRVERLELASQQRIVILADGRLVAAGADLEPRNRTDMVAAWSSDPTGEEGDIGDGEMGESTEVAVAPPRTFLLGGRRYVGTALPIPGADRTVAARLIAYRSLEDAMAPARRLRLTLVAIALGGLLLAFVFSYSLARSVTRPVQHLMMETRRLGSGDLEHPIQPERDDEIGKLAEGFETMRTSLRSARKDLLRAERLSAVGRAASAIVHDFTQPVTIIQANVDLLELDWDEPEARDEDLKSIRGGLHRLMAMMQEILDFARGEDRIRRTTDSVPLLLESVVQGSRPQADAAGVELVMEHGYGGEWSLDFPRTTRVVENLVRNAIAAVGSGGTIRLESSLDEGRLHIEVADDGPGIPEEVRDTLFEPFVTQGKEKGTGLGLAIARSFTERQGATIRFETSSAGTTFILEFPDAAEGEA